ncbi:MAG: hypothetical protein IKB77_02615 [Lentisphaeria bacterium]|nr:hypothetical protein [Lentisphaeria bacterium]
MLGLGIDTFELWDSLDFEAADCGTVIKADAELFQNQSFVKKLKKIHPAVLIVNNAVSPRLNRLILESGSKLQNDYLESLCKSFKYYSTLQVSKATLDFDLPSVLPDEKLTCELNRILCAIQGFAYEYSITAELLFRLPLPETADFIRLAAFFRQRHMSNMNYAVDVHIHEGAFDLEALTDTLLPIQYDTGTVNFLYDAALGNRVNAANLHRTVEMIQKKGAECDFTLCPAGGVNFQSVRQDVLQWLEPDAQ